MAAISKARSLIDMVQPRYGVVVAALIFEEALMSNDYIPQGDDTFLQWIRNLIAYVLLHAERMAIPAGAIGVLQPLLAEFETAFEKMADPNHGKLDTQRKNETRDALKTATRAFVMGYITYNPNVTDDDRREMGTPIHSKTHTPAPIPKERPIIDTVAVDNRQIAVDIREISGDKRGKPAGMHGVEILLEVRDDAPPLAEDLRHSTFTTRMRMVHTFTEAERGKRVYFVARWESNSNKKGPWSDIISAIIP
jgi:hypothetical protein